MPIIQRPRPVRVPMMSIATPCPVSQNQSASPTLWSTSLRRGRDSPRKEGEKSALIQVRIPNKKQGERENQQHSGHGPDHTGGEVAEFFPDSSQTCSTTRRKVPSRHQDVPAPVSRSPLRKRSSMLLAASSEDRKSLRTDGARRSSEPREDANHRQNDGASQSFRGP